MILYWDIHQVLQPIQQFAIIGDVVAAYANRNLTWRWAFIVCAISGAAAVLSGFR
jgi:hypothetical protein